MGRKEPARCIFCNREQVSDEHVFGLWISDLMADATPFTLNKTPGRSASGLKKINVKARAPCVMCNNGWMARSEDETKDLIAPMIRGQNLDWDVEQQAIVARWAFKTALMLDRSSLASRVAPKQHFTHLFEHQAPPATVSIYIARYYPDIGEEAVGVIGSSYRPTSGVDPRLYPNPYQITFSIGQAVFQVFGHTGAAPLEIRRLGTVGGSSVIIPVTDGLPRLWPINVQALHWPPGGFYLNTENLQTLARF